MTRFFQRVVLACVTAALLPVFASACKQSSSDNSVAAPTPPTTTEEFTSTLTQKGANVHVFAVSAQGTTTIAYTAVAPLSTMSLGLALGTYAGTVCTAVTTLNDARVGGTAIKGTAAAGSYCVKVFDSGNIMPGTEVAYTVQVVHP